MTIMNKENDGKSAVYCIEKDGRKNLIGIFEYEKDAIINVEKLSQYCPDSMLDVEIINSECEECQLVRYKNTKLKQFLEAVE